MTSLTVVSGPPCSGKSTYVREHASSSDLVVDLDTIARALGYPDDHVTWDDDHPALHAARIARNAVVAAITKGQIPGAAWVIDARPHSTSVHIYRRLGATIVPMDTSLSECRTRAIDAGRPASTLAQLDAWAQPSGASALTVFGSSGPR